MTEIIPRRRFLASGLATVGTTALAAASYARVAGANERIGLGFIGYGLIGKRHVADFKLEPDVDLVAISEAHRDRRDEGRMALGGGASEYADFRKLLDDRSVDAVVISTPDHWHALQTMLACAAGKDVYVEKPLTLFQCEGQWMNDVAARTKRVVQVGTQQRSGKHYQRARELMRDGRLGTIHTVRAQSSRNIGDGFGKPADCDPPPELDWNMWLGPAPMRPFNPLRAIYHFRWFWDYSGGQTTNLGAHQFDVVDWVLGLGGLASVASIGGRFAVPDGGETPDTQDAILDCGKFTLSWSLREASRGERVAFGLDFFGTNGQLGLSRAGFALTPDLAMPPENLIPGVGEHPIGGPTKAQLTTPGAIPLRADPIVDKTGSSDEQYRLHVRNFLDCIKSRQKPIADLESAHRTATACHLINLSLRLGRQVRWDADKQQCVSDREANAALVRPYRAPWDAELRAVLP